MDTSKNNERTSPWGDDEATDRIIAERKRKRSRTSPWGGQEDGGSADTNTQETTRKGAAQ